MAEGNPDSNPVGPEEFEKLVWSAVYWLGRVSPGLRRAMAEAPDHLVMLEKGLTSLDAANRALRDVVPGLRPGASTHEPLEEAVRVRTEKLLEEGKEWRDMYRRAADERDRLLLALYQGSGDVVPDVESALAGDIADVLLEGGARSPLGFARHLLRSGGALAPLLARRAATAGEAQT